MKVQYILGITICFIISFLSCTKHDESTSKLLPELVKAEEIMYEAPDSALHILQMMPIPLPSDKLQYSTWALFMTQAKYKLYMNQSDSLINIAYNYFIRQNNSQRKALAAYYYAIICKENKHDIEKAQKLCLKATEEVAQCNDYKLGYLIYSELGDIYIYRSLYEYALDSYKKAFGYAEKSQKISYQIYSYMNLGRIFGELNQIEESINSYKNAIVIATENKDVKALINGLNELASIYNAINDYESALFYAKEAIKNRNDSFISPSEQQYLMLGEVYLNIGEKDSAYHYLQKAITTSNIYTLRNVFLDLYYLEREQKQFENANMYLEKAWINHDSILKVDKSKALIEMQEKYNQQKIINEKNEIKLKKNKTISQILVCLVTLIIIIALLIYIYQKKILEKERLIKKAEEVIRIKSVQIQENETIINRNQKRMDDLNIQINKNKDIQEQIEEQKQILADIQKYNSSLERENYILQCDINKLSSTLKEKSRELNHLNHLTKENLYLHERERFLTNQLVIRNELLAKLISKPKYVDEKQWVDIIRAINFLFDDYTHRLSKLVPSLTDGDIQICCLIKLHITNSTISTILAISPTSVTKRKQRLKERIILEIGSFKDGQNLDLWLWEF